MSQFNCSESCFETLDLKMRNWKLLFSAVNGRILLVVAHVDSAQSVARMSELSGFPIMCDIIGVDLYETTPHVFEGLAL